MFRRINGTMQFIEFCTKWSCKTHTHKNMCWSMADAWINSYLCQSTDSYIHHGEWNSFMCNFFVNFLFSSPKCIISGHQVTIWIGSDEEFWLFLIIFFSISLSKFVIVSFEFVKLLFLFLLFSFSCLNVFCFPFFSLNTWNVKLFCKRIQVSFIIDIICEQRMMRRHSKSKV